VASYRDIGVNYCVGAASWAAVVAVAACLDFFLQEAVSLIIAGVAAFPVLIGAQRKIVPGRKAIVITVCGAGVSAGLAGLTSAPYLEPQYRLLFFPAFLFIILFIGYLVFALFSAAPPHEESARNVRFPPVRDAER
jgi:hypothetical protein